MIRIQELNLRRIHPTDAEAYLELLEALAAESPHVLYQPGEYGSGARDEMAQIESVLARPNQMIFVVEDRDRLIAWLGAFGERYQRVAHTALLGIGVLGAYQRRGIGQALFQEAERWARAAGLRRLELLVQSGNFPAISLYRKMGFQIEGTKRESYRIGGEYVDEYLMAKLLTPPPPPRNPYPKW